MCQTRSKRKVWKWFGWKKYLGEKNSNSSTFLVHFEVCFCCHLAQLLRIRWRRCARPWKHLVRRGCRFPSWSLEGLSGSLSCFQQQMHLTWSKRSLGSMNLWRWMDALWCRTVWLAKSIEMMWTLRVVAYPFVSMCPLRFLRECFVLLNFGVKVCNLLEENNTASAKQKEAWKMATLSHFGCTGWCPNA